MTKHGFYVNKYIEISTKWKVLVMFMRLLSSILTGMLIIVSFCVLGIVLQTSTAESLYVETAQHADCTKYESTVEGFPVLAVEAPGVRLKSTDINLAPEKLHVTLGISETVRTCVAEWMCVFSVAHGSYFRSEKEYKTQIEVWNPHTYRVDTYSCNAEHLMGDENA